MRLAIVISRPSRTQVIPSATTTRVWKRAHGRRSIRAGTRLLMTTGVVAGTGAGMDPARLWPADARGGSAGRPPVALTGSRDPWFEPIDREVVSPRSSLGGGGGAVRIAGRRRWPHAAQHRSV